MELGLWLIKQRGLEVVRYLVVSRRKARPFVSITKLGLRETADHPWWERLGGQGLVRWAKEPRVSRLCKGARDVRRLEHFPVRRFVFAAWSSCRSPRRSAARNWRWPRPSRPGSASSNACPARPHDGARPGRSRGAGMAPPPLRFTAGPRTVSSNRDRDANHTSAGS